MFARVSTIFTVLPFAMLAAATAVPRTTPSDQCDAGTIECCNSVIEAHDPYIGLIAGLLHVDFGPIEGFVGLTCTPIIGGSSCSQQTVCCTGTNYNGIIVLGCTPININV